MWFLYGSSWASVEVLLRPCSTDPYSQPFPVTSSPRRRLSILTGNTAKPFTSPVHSSSLWPQCAVSGIPKAISQVPVFPEAGEAQEGFFHTTPSTGALSTNMRQFWRQLPTWRHTGSSPQPSTHLPSDCRELVQVTRPSCWASLHS